MLSVRVCDADEVFFTRNGDVLEATERVTITKKDDVHTLQISETEEADVGEYMVLCENKYGHVSSSANILVTGNSYSPCVLSALIVYYQLSFLLS